MPIYFVRDAATGLVKIGWAVSPSRRLKELQTGSAGLLTVLATRPGERADEVLLHVKHGSARRRGEWFTLTPEVVAEVASCSPAFAALAAADRRLIDLAGSLAAALAVPADEPFCANAFWNGTGGWGGPSVKDRLSKLVGWGRETGPYDLKTSEAYDVVSDTLYGLLPDCRDCGCL